MSVVVSDTSPIRALHHLALIAVLTDLFGEVLVPPAVARELAQPPSGLAAIAIGRLAGVRVVAPGDAARVAQLRETLDPGESEALTLALELHAAVLIDEAEGRATARRLGLPVIGVVGILVRAKQRGLVEEVAPLLVRLQRELSFFISDDLMREARRLAGE